ncbi:MAG: ABC transporter ATP-binding protein [Solirubrobacteraceae bacterium]
MSLVECRAVSYTYPGASTPALSDLQLTIEPGELVVLAGLSGSGKSTLLRVLNGLAPHFYGGEFGGDVRIAGLDARLCGPALLAEHVGSLFQDPETQVILGTPRSELAFPLENRGWAPTAIARAVEETALALGIERLLDRTTDTLSGGELQRVALGATLVARPAVVCLDEPTSQLDPVAGEELIGLLRRLNEDTDLTVVLAEHRLERCLPAADRVLALDAGQLIFDGSAPDFLEFALINAVRLVTPGARLLADCGLRPRPGVKAARAALRQVGYRLDPAGSVLAGRRPTAPRVSARPAAQPVLALRHVWHELRDGPVILRDVTLALAAGERVALMGRNGAGKSTLLRHSAGLMAPTRGSVKAAGRVALLLQNPGDYLVSDTVSGEVDGNIASLERFGLDALLHRHPRDLSGGERQRLALAVVLGGDPADHPAAVCLDEPTRGMDRVARDQLRSMLEAYDGAVVVATHDAEFAAEFAGRVVLLAEGRVIADGPTAEILTGGDYFTTETARILAGLRTSGVILEVGDPDAASAGPALLPTQGAELLKKCTPCRQGMVA